MLFNYLVLPSRIDLILSGWMHKKETETQICITTHTRYVAKPKK